METNEYESLETRLGYVFRDPGLLRTALTHRSFLNEHPGIDRADNQRLEFLGDAVLNLAVSQLLMEEFPQHSEGELTKARANLVNEGALAEVAESVMLGEWLFLGRGMEQSGGRHKPSLLADACEAVMAAVFLESGFEAALALARRLFGERLHGAAAPVSGEAKTRLQERAQAVFRTQPRYQLVGAQGPDHDKRFEVALFLGEREVARGQGKSKKEAEQRAAEHALALLDEPEKGA